MIRNNDPFRKALAFASLGSGSRGNCAVVSAGDAAVLVDCGVTFRQVGQRLRLLGLDPARLQAILVSHEHTDHVGGLRVTAGRLGIPVLSTEGCERRLRAAGHLADGVQTRRLPASGRTAVGPFEIESFRVPHDAADPIGFVVGCGGERIGFATDMGAPPDGLARTLGTCSAVLLEFNHDVEMLLAGPYAWSLKQRIRSPKGHLSNAQAAAIVEELRRGGRLAHLVLGHLSEVNNTPALALAAARRGLGAASAVRVCVAGPHAPTELIGLVARPCGTEGGAAK